MKRRKCTEWSIIHLYFLPVGMCDQQLHTPTTVDSYHEGYSFILRAKNPLLPPLSGVCHDNGNGNYYKSALLGNGACLKIVFHSHAWVSS